MRLPKFRDGKYPLQLPQSAKEWVDKRAAQRTETDGKKVYSQDIYNEAVFEYMANHPEPPKEKSKIKIQSTYWPESRQKGGSK